MKTLISPGLSRASSLNLKILIYLKLLFSLTFSRASSFNHDGKLLFSLTFLRASSLGFKVFGVQGLGFSV